MLHTMLLYIIPHQPDAVKSIFQLSYILIMVLRAFMLQTKYDKNICRIFVLLTENKCSARRITKKAAIRLAKRGEIAKYS